MQVLGLLTASIALLTVASCGSMCSSREPGRTSTPKPDETVPSTPEAPRPGTRASAAAETVWFETSDGKRLAATLRRGRRAEAPAAILVHGLASDRSEWELLVEALSRPPGLTTLALDMRGHGDSEGGPEGWREMGAEAWQAIDRDVVGAVDYFEARPDLRPGRIVAVGASLGSSAVVLAAAEDDRIDAVALLSPGRSYRGVDAITPVRQLGSRPLLALAAEGERHSVRTAAEMARIADQGTKQIVEGSAHGVFMLPEAPAMKNALVEFIRGARDR